MKRLWIAERIRPEFNDLVDRARNFVAAEGRDHPLDLPPVAEARDIAEVTAALGASCCLEPGIVAEALDELRRVRKRQASMDEGQCHDAP